MVRARTDYKPQFKPIPKPSRDIGDVIKEAAKQVGEGLKPGPNKPMMQDDKYKGDAGGIWDKIGDLADKIPDAPSDVLDDVQEAAENAIETVVDKVAEKVAQKAAEKVADKIGDALNPF